MFEVIKEIHRKTKKSYIQIFLDIIRCFILFGSKHDEYYDLKFYEINDEDKRALKEDPDKKVFGKGFSFVKVVYILFISVILYLTLKYSPIWSIIFYLLTYRHIDTNKLSKTIIRLIIIGLVLSIIYALLFRWSYSEYLDDSSISFILELIGRVCLYTIPEVLLAGILSDYIFFPLIDRFVETMEYRAAMVITIIVGILMILGVIFLAIVVYAYLFLI